MNPLNKGGVELIPAANEDGSLKRNVYHVKINGLFVIESDTAAITEYDLNGPESIADLQRTLRLIAR